MYKGVVHATVGIARNQRSRTSLVTMLFSTALFLALAGVITASPTPEILEKRAVSCLTVGATATAQWTNSAGKTCTWTGTVGSNFGPNPSGSGE